MTSRINSLAKNLIPTYDLLVLILHSKLAQNLLSLHYITLTLKWKKMPKHFRHHRH